MSKTAYTIGKRMIEKDMFIVNRVYVDINFLKYVKLGWIVSHQDLAMRHYTGIYDIVSSESFITRNTDDPEILFRDDQDILDLLRIPNLRSEDIIFTVSPVWDGTIEFIQKGCLISDAAKKVIGIKSPTTIAIDLSSLPNLSNVLRDRIVEEYTELFGTNIELIDTQPATNDILNFDAYYVQDIASFSRTYIDALNEERFGEKHIFCSELLPLKDVPNIKEDDIPTLFKCINLTMSAASLFHIIPPFPCLT